MDDGLQHLHAIAKTPKKNYDDDDEILLMKELEDSYSFSFWSQKHPQLFLLLAWPAGPGEAAGNDMHRACESASGS